MSNTFKKIVAIIVSLSLLSPTLLSAYTLGTSATITNQDGHKTTNYKTCTVPTVQEFSPTGDTQGKSVLTKREYVRDCNVTVTEQGKCIKWEENKERYSLTLDDYNTYETENYTDALGTLLSTLGAYDQIGHIWSGWKGYCHIGIKSDFSWAKDPMFWASLAMSFIMSATSDGGMLSKTPVGDTINGAAETTGKAAQAGMQAAGETFKEATGAVGEQVTGALTKIGEGIQYAKDQVNSFMDTIGSALDSLNPFSDPSAVGSTVGNVAGGSSAISSGTQLGLKQLSSQALGRCLIAEATNMATAVYQFAQDDASDASGLSCDPVDEVCDASANSNSSTAGGVGQDVLTADETTFNEAVENFTKNQDKSATKKNFYDYIEVIKIENKIVYYRFKMNSEIPGMENVQNNKELESLEQSLKETRLALSLTMSTASMAGCMMGVNGHDGKTTVNSTTGKNSGNRMDARQIGGMVIDQLAKFMGPYGPIIALVAKLILQTATSFTKVDTCHNEQDAQEAGRRHQQTQKSLEFNLCHLIKKKCIESNALAKLFKGGGKCTLMGYWYCCYDQILTKTLVTQLKAQLGRDYTHCTGITLRDLNYVSLRQCTKAEMASGIDGAREFEDPNKYDPTKTFQYKNKCVDMGEFLAYLQSTVGTDVSITDFQNYWNDLTTQGTEGGLINNGVN